MPDSTLHTIESQVDWLTVTTTSPAHIGNLESLGKNLVDTVTNRENIPKPWHWKQYAGVHCGPVTYGVREDSEILQLSGGLADEFFDIAMRQADNCTRIDLAVTVRHEPTVEGVASGIYSECLRWRQERGTGPNYSFISNSDGGSTVYIGSRVSDLYGRCYDKQRESGLDQYAGCWRWEVEIKGDIAGRTARSLHTCDDRANRIRATVHRFYSRRGSVPQWSCDQEPMHLAHIRPRSDIATKLRWLTTAVRGTVGYLVERGYESAVIEALGLDMSREERARKKHWARGDHHNDELLGEQKDIDGGIDWSQ